MLEGLDQKLSRVEYEELSSQVYDYEEEKNLHVGNRDMIDMERENLQVQAEQTEEASYSPMCQTAGFCVRRKRGTGLSQGENRGCRDSRELIWNRREKHLA